MSRMPRPRGMLTILSSASGPRVSKRCLPSTTAVPTTMASTIRIVKMALPTMTSGWRALAERRGGWGTRSGSSAAGGLRGEIRFCSLPPAVGPATDPPFGIPLPTSRSLGLSPLPTLLDYRSGTETAPSSRYPNVYQGRHAVQQTRPPMGRAGMGELSDSPRPRPDRVLDGICGGRTAGALIHGAEHQRGVGPPETEGIRQHGVDLPLLRLVGHEVAWGVERRIVEIDGGRRDVVANRQNREDRLDGAGRAQQMADRGLGRRHRDLGRRIAHHALHRVELDLVAERGRGAMGIDVVELGRRDAGALERHGHAAIGAVAVLGRRRDVIGVARQPVADELGIDLRAAAARMLVFLQHHDAGALAHHEAVAVLVVGTRGARRLVVEAGRERAGGRE